ncbi:MAG: sensor histidine kinase [Campylobacterota bacterium]
MQLKIKYKLLLLIFIPLLISFVLITLIYNNHLHSHFQKIALQDTSHRLAVFIDRLETAKLNMQNLTTQITQDHEVLSALNLIVNYQDPHDYRYLIFDEEKRKLLNRYTGFSTNDHSYSISYFDKDKNLIAYSKHDSDDQRHIITSYGSDAKPLYLDQDNQTQILSPTITELLYDSAAYYIQDDILHIQTIAPIFRADSIIGHVRVTYYVDSDKFIALTKDIDESFFLLAKDTIFSNDGKNLKITYADTQAKERGFITRADFIYNFTTLCKNTDNGRIYAVATLSKAALNKDLESLFYQVGTVLFIVFAILVFFLSIFTNKYMLQPLHLLLESINELKEKKHTTISIQSKDELGQISARFNELSKQLHEAMTKQEETTLLLENILNTTHIRIFTKDRQGRYFNANKMFLKDCGLQHKEQIIGKTDKELPWQDSQREDFVSDDERVMQTGEPILRKEELQTQADGNIHTILTSKVPLKEQNGELIGLLGVYDDITEQKEVRKQLQEKEKYLLHQSRLAQMGEMISMIAHQWRQPLAAISSTANALSLKVAMGRYEESFFESRLENINSYSQHLSATIDDFRNFFKKHKEKKEITLEQLVDDSLNIIQTSMDHRSIEIIKEYHCRQKVQTYPNEVRQVILNLLKNAEDVLVELDKKEKWVKIRTGFTDSACFIEIEDNGGGIDEEIMDKLFEPYFSTKESRDGTGLGLYMSQIIIKEHCKGKLTARNSSEGAVFKVEL